ncbi:MAG: cytochrome P450 [Acidimicrobiales bacterium]
MHRTSAEPAPEGIGQILSGRHRKRSKLREMVDLAEPAPVNDFDPLAPETNDSAHAVYRDLRKSCPVAHSSAYGGFWALLRHADVDAAARDPELFISSVRAVVPSDPRGIRRPPLNFDAPAHTPFRKALERTLERERLVSMEPRLREHAVRELEPLIRAGHGDIAKQFGTTYPAFVAAEWLNLPDDKVYELAETASIWVDAWRRQDPETVTAKSNDMYAMARQLVADRRESPRDPTLDPASALLEASYEGAPLDDELIVGALRQSLVVGLVAPPLLLGAIAIHLADSPELHDQLRSDVTLVAPAIEEFLRLYTPYRGFSRTTSRDVELHGRVIHPAEPVTLVYASANRDETVFSEPDEFVMGRSNIGRHLAFGAGPHRCLGMSLARLSIRIAVEELVTRTRRIEIAGDIEPTRMPELGPQRVPMRLIPV